ncbi:hypothetical protein KY285_023874 [Solanum tuberosum]|nr:hypothetical protein KY289_024208 [Solanum tuberosum]KAH0676073.1 hypothetical protein KY285_023874 [Solanum tuberosum]
MNDVWPHDFEVSLEGAKLVVAELGANLTDFGPLSLFFEHRILAHIIATTLLPRKRCLSSISNRDVFVLYCLLKKYRINWVLWIKEYTWESSEESNPSNGLPYGLLISRILVDRLVDLSMFKPIEISATYDSRTFSSMGYVEVGNRWVKKDSIRERVNTTKPTKISAESAALLLQDSDELKTHILAVEHGLETLHDAVEKEGIATVNKLIRQVDSLKSGVSSSNNDLAIYVQNSYSSLSKYVERSYNTFCGKVINTLKYFWGENR